MAKHYYEYETSPRKRQPSYTPNKRKTSKNRSKINKQIEINEEQRREYMKLEKKKHNKNVAFVIAIFLILLVISYRNSLINEEFSKLQTQKGKLAAIEKTNGQLEVSIEESLNLSTIEEEAKARLGMQKLDNNQKVYVELDKKDYVEASKDIDISQDTSLPWYKVIINKILGK